MLCASMTFQGRLMVEVDYPTVDVRRVGRQRSDMILIHPRQPFGRKRFPLFHGRQK